MATDCPVSPIVGAARRLSMSAKTTSSAATRGSLRTSSYAPLIAGALRADSYALLLSFVVSGKPNSLRAISATFGKLIFDKLPCKPVAPTAPVLSLVTELGLDKEGSSESPRSNASLAASMRGAASSLSLTRACCSFSARAATGARVASAVARNAGVILR